MRFLVAEGAEVVVSDADPRGCSMRWRAKLGATAVAAGIEIEQECDVLSPCAAGWHARRGDHPGGCGVVPWSAPANNQLGDGPGADRELAARGSSTCPDFVANAGGIINIAEEFTGYDRERALRGGGYRHHNDAGGVVLAEHDDHHHARGGAARGASASSVRRLGAAVGAGRSRGLDERANRPRVLRGTVRG